jgi:hypothetical protein
MIKPHARAPLQGANDVWLAIMFQGDFLPKSPFALTVHTLGVRRICIIPAPTGPTAIAQGAAGTLENVPHPQNIQRPAWAHGILLVPAIFEKRQAHAPREASEEGLHGDEVQIRIHRRKHRRFPWLLDAICSASCIH